MARPLLWDEWIPHDDTDFSEPTASLSGEHVGAGLERNMDEEEEIEDDEENAEHHEHSGVQ